MSSALDMSLDDIIKNSKKSGSGNFRGRDRGRGRGRPSGTGPARRFPNRGPNRAAPYPTAKAPESTWQHDMFRDQSGRTSSLEGNKLYISNLDYGVSNEDIKELFSEVGELKRYSIHYDRSGRSKGTAEVVFSRQAEAVAAVKRYNNVQLDGKPMKIEIVGTNFVAPHAPITANAAFGNSNGLSGRVRGRGGALGRLRGGSGRGFARGRGRGRGRGEKLREFISRGRKWNYYLVFLGQGKCYLQGVENRAFTGTAWCSSVYQFLCKLHLFCPVNSQFPDRVMTADVVHYSDFYWPLCFIEPDDVENIEVSKGLCSGSATAWSGMQHYRLTANIKNADVSPLMVVMLVADYLEHQRVNLTALELQFENCSCIQAMKPLSIASMQQFLTPNTLKESIYLRKSEKKVREMSSALDMSLDDIIKNSKKSGSGNYRGRGRGRPSGTGPARRFPNRSANRASPYPAAMAPESTWQHDMFRDQSGRTSFLEGSKLYISNLDYGVSNEDIKELFSEVGELKRYSIHYDRSGRSKGTAEIVFSRPAEAVAAVEKYNNVQLDGKLMKIEIVGTNFVTRAPPPANVAFGNSNGVSGRMLSSGKICFKLMILMLSLVANAVQLCVVPAEFISAFFGRVRGGALGRLRGGGGSGGRGFGRGHGRGRGRGEKTKKLPSPRSEELNFGRNYLMLWCLIGCLFIMKSGRYGRFLCKLHLFCPVNYQFPDRVMIADIAHYIDYNWHLCFIQPDDVENIEVFKALCFGSAIARSGMQHYRLTANINFDFGYSDSL
ncbi:unnamed protein product [Dovyalis caffra]|uniref:RRM domain-containing protein n=1 Tax=Dovyalis caffra TaxID=77055 RepID=A0AAV1RE21_9ROSI|nr:unnamed protein product [Dovyalis caffra]